MESSGDRINILKEDMARIRQEKPHVATLVDAFGPVLLAEYALQENWVDTHAALAPDKLKTMSGIPLIKEQPLFFHDDPWQGIALAVTGAIKEGFPHFSEDMARLMMFFQQNPDRLTELFLPSGPPVTGEVPAWTADSQAEPVALALMTNTIKRVILTARAKALAKEVASIPWNKGYCPICGSFPLLAFLRVNGQRWLHCAGCHHEWAYPRPQCPWCEHETPAETVYLYLEDEKESSVYLCEKCRKYLITVNRAESLREMDPDLTAISLAHLDVILQGKGFSPMAEREWNVFE